MYAELKILHVACVTISIAGFTVRGWGALHDAAWMRVRWVRIAPHIVDTVLLASGVGMAVLLGAAVWQSGWLLAKLTGLVAYIVLGSVAIKQGRRLAVRRSAFIAALLAATWIVSAALTKSAWGPMALLMAAK